MKILFNVEYHTTFGEELVLNILSGEEISKSTIHKMTTLDGLHWFCEVSKSPKTGTYIDYYYSLFRGETEMRHEWLMEPHRLEFAAVKGRHRRGALYVIRLGTRGECRNHDSKIERFLHIHVMVFTKSSANVQRYIGIKKIFAQF